MKNPCPGEKHGRSEKSGLFAQDSEGRKARTLQPPAFPHHLIGDNKDEDSCTGIRRTFPRYGIQQNSDPYIERYRHMQTERLRRLLPKIEELIEKKCEKV
jgi:hypothetical protein